MKANSRRPNSHALNRVVGAADNSLARFNGSLGSDISNRIQTALGKIYFVPDPPVDRRCYAMWRKARAEALRESILKKAFEGK
jgi:hypothetical protein